MSFVSDIGEENAVALRMEGWEEDVFAFEYLGGLTVGGVGTVAGGGCGENLGEGAGYRGFFGDVEDYGWSHGGWGVAGAIAWFLWISSWLFYFL